MTPAEYKSLRAALGTQQKVADVLGLSRETVARRETGDYPLTAESILAIKYLQQHGIPEITGGTFTVTDGNKTTAPIPHNATKPQIRKAVKKAGMRMRIV
jgi:DNA-binding XRE family transcriptional regulator